ncbi:MAG: S8 family serine peptidase [Ignavibacteria bacterium]|nr:S8 family serine peptidase [Ignavibacteria bacterium]
MKRFPAILLFLVFISNASSQEAYYYCKGVRISLEPRPDKIAVVLNRAGTDEFTAGRIVSDAFGGDIDFSMPSDNVCLVTFNGNKTAGEIISMTGQASAGNPLVKFATPVYFGQSHRVTQIPADEFVVRLNNINDLEKLAALNIMNNVSVIGNVNGEKGFLLKSNDGVKINALELSRIYYATGLFEFAEPNFIYPDYCLLNSVPNDEFFSKQWTLRNTGQTVPTGSTYYGDEPNAGGLPDADIDADLAWDITMGSNLISIGVFDTGIDSTHPDFSIPGHLLPGYDAIWNKYGVPKDSGNYGGHGTCASGIAGAVANNGVGVAGVAPQCRLMAFRIFNLTGASTSVGIARAFDTARVTGVDVISNSWNGFTENSTVTDAINNAALLGRNGKGCLIFFAAGNDGRRAPWYPAYLAYVSAVGASTMLDQKKTHGTGNQFFWGSNYGESEKGDLDLVAPSICYTTDIQGVFGYVNQPGTAGNYYPHFPGTSASCPHAAGVAGLMLSVNPSLTRTELFDKLYRACDKIENVEYSVSKTHGKWNELTGYGRLNAYQSVQLALGTDATPPTIVHRNIASHESTYPTKITAEITDHDGSPVTSVGDDAPILFYRLNRNNQGWTQFDSLTADTVELNSYTFTIPCLGLETQVQYYIKAKDNAGNTAVFPKGAPDNNWLCYFSVASKVTKSKTVGPFACLDGGNVTVSPNVTFDNFTITDSKVQIWMQHGRVSDAVIQLYSPSANSGLNRKCLFASNGGNGADIRGAVVSDTASNFWTEGTPPYEGGSFRPDYPLRGLNGTNAAGDWKIFHYDQLYSFAAAYDSAIITFTGNSGLASPCIAFDSPEDTVLNFGNVLFPDSSVKEFYVRNSGNTPLVIDSIVFSGSFATRFSLAGQIPAQILPGDSSALSVILRTHVPDNNLPAGRMNSIADNVESSVMEIYNNDPSKSVFRVSLQTDQELRRVSVLTLSVLIQAMYDAVADTSGTDTIQVNIRNTTFPFQVVESSKSVLHNNGTANFLLQNVTDSVNYFIEVIHRNSVTTWSAEPGQMFVNRRLSYDMTASASSAYGQNLIRANNSPDRYAIYSGDVDRDGFVDGTDLITISNDASLLKTGYISTDLNGDGFVDGTDALIAGNNATGYIGVVSPP